MYNNTPEGRVTYQNKKAVEIINEINNAHILEKKIKTIIYTIPSQDKKQIIQKNSETDNTENKDDSNSDTESESETELESDSEN